ncbi:hypothetical protein J7I84_05625 [Arthrobacter sp. ISL-85]|uniref:hypothetical protein n=1 Tax=Arthrobacter sp. ISL-85 TaxID=2819115 RepID=UPI001BE77AC5|nr:hypothetical protein [Arthrobacter sp. ISL-85]MBT2565983.1 hypothetical protein [Arthrobacter sp. ISL-85]
MTENPEVAAEEPREGSSAPGLEGEGGQYVDGDYGNAGTINEPDRGAADGEYEEGDYGDAGATGGARTENAIREGLTDGQVQGTAEERGPLHGDRDTER